VYSNPFVADFPRVVGVDSPHVVVADSSHFVVFDSPRDFDSPSLHHL